jgi:nucleotidyltransferase/DNA polymerase involved in DNA repair
VIRPDMDKYRHAGREVRRFMLELTPLVEPVSIDEAFLDLTGTSRLHEGSPALTLARFAKRVEAEVASTSRSASHTTSSWPSSPPTSRNHADSRSSARGRPQDPGRNAGLSAPRRRRRGPETPAVGERYPDPPFAYGVPSPT